MLFGNRLLVRFVFLLKERISRWPNWRTSQIQFSTKIETLNSRFYEITLTSCFALIWLSWKNWSNVWNDFMKESFSSSTLSLIKFCVDRRNNRGSAQLMIMMNRAGCRGIYLVLQDNLPNSADWIRNGSLIVWYIVPESTWSLADVIWLVTYYVFKGTTTTTTWLIIGRWFELIAQDSQCTTTFASRRRRRKKWKKRNASRGEKNPRE